MRPIIHHPRSSVRRSMILSIALTAAVLSAAGVAQAQDISTVDVKGSRPTAMTVRVAGLEFPEVRRVVHKTAFTVCRNAVRNGDLDLFDVTWCANRASNRAMTYYRAALQSHAALGEVRAPSLTITMAAVT